MAATEKNMSDLLKITADEQASQQLNQSAIDLDDLLLVGALRSDVIDLTDMRTSDPQAKGQGNFLPTVSSKMDKNPSLVDLATVTARDKQYLELGLVGSMPSDRRDPKSFCKL